MKVLVILEDPTLDEHIAVPVVSRLFKEIGRTAQVSALRDPHFRGQSQALNEDNLRHVFALHPMVDLFLLLLDRDCDREGVAARAAAREALSPKLVAALAHEELETWLLALHAAELSARWSAVKAHCDPKEAWAEPLLEKYGGRGAVGGGRAAAMRELSGKWRTLLSLCPEIDLLQSRLAERFR